MKCMCLHPFFSVLGSVGEPINPEAWLWYYKLIGKEKCSIVDTFWQTETGGHVITPLPGATLMKPGSAVSVAFLAQIVVAVLILSFFCCFFSADIPILWCEGVAFR